MPAKAIFGVMLVIGTAACAATAGPPRDTRIDPAPRQLSHLTTRERRDLMDRAQVWHSIETAQLDLLAGPDGKGSFPFDSNVTCAFDYPKKPLNGETPKFDCTLPEGDSVKVKYGQDNGEVFSEVAATRLFWVRGSSESASRCTCRSAGARSCSSTGAVRRKKRPLETPG